jgi:hypothetical protein
MTGGGPAAWLLPVVVLLATAGASSPQTEMLETVTSSIGFKCLPAETQQRFADGGSILWQGSDPERDDVCLGRTGDGETIAKARGIWAVSPSMPGGMAEIRNAMEALTTGKPATKTSFTVPGGPSNDPGRHVLHFALRVTGQATADLLVGRVNVYVIDGDEHGEGPSAYRGTVRIWLERESHAVLKWQTTDLRTGQTQTSETEALTLPQ